jgi:hypothetical protein
VHRRNGLLRVRAGAQQRLQTGHLVCTQLKREGSKSEERSAHGRVWSTQDAEMYENYAIKSLTTRRHNALPIDHAPSATVRSAHLPLTHMKAHI